MEATHIQLIEGATGRFLGSRMTATPVRESMETALREGREVLLDFEGVSVTQGFVDELVGRLVLVAGPSVLQRISFRKCSEDVKGILKFVIDDRAKMHAEGLARGA